MQTLGDETMRLYNLRKNVLKYMGISYDTQDKLTEEQLRARYLDIQDGELADAMASLGCFPRQFKEEWTRICKLTSQMNARARAEYVSARLKASSN